MTLQFELWQFLTLLGVFLVFSAGAGKLLLGQMQQHLDTKFTSIGERLDGIESANRDEANQWQRVERERMALKAEMPLHYVRREDYIRGQSVIEAKLDGLALKIENVQLRGRNHAID
jgi:hypothetical protein